MANQLGIKKIAADDYSAAIFFRLNTCLLKI